MREAVGDRIARRVPLAYAVQASALPPGFAPPPGRSKPWGTGHATLAAAPLLDGPFAVINADDFYGAVELPGRWPSTCGARGRRRCPSSRSSASRSPRRSAPTAR